LTALGYATELQTGLACNDFGYCGTPTNIIATYGGDVTGKDAVLLAAHYDSVPRAPALPMTAPALRVCSRSRAI